MRGRGSIDYQGKQIALVTDQEVISLTEGVGCYRLKLQYEIEPKVDHHSLKLSDFRGSLAVMNRANHHHYGALGELRMAPTVMDISIPGGGGRVEGELTLSPSQLGQIRKSTQGEDVQLETELDVKVITSNADDTSWLDTSIETSVPQSEWLKLLDKSGFSSVFLFEVVMPDGEHPYELDASVKHLKKARSHHDKGDYEDAVASCRKSIEALVDGLGFDLGEGAAEYRENQKEMSLGSREQLLREITRHFAHPAAHSDQTDIDPTYNQRDASLVLNITAALVESALGEAESNT